MKINRLLDPITPGGAGATTVAPSAPVTPTPAPVTSTPPSNPGDSAKAARAERLAKDIFEEPGEAVATIEKTVVPAVTPTASSTPAPVQLSQDQLAQLVGARQTSVPQQQPQLTQAEIDQQLGVVNVTGEMAIELGLPAESAPFLTKLAKAIVTNAVRMSNVIVQQNAAEINARIAPHITFAQQQQHLMLEHQFNEANPDLKGYEPIIKDVASKLKASGFRGTQKEAFTKIAEDTREYLKSMGIAPGQVNTNGAGASNGVSASTPKPTMSTVSAGSQGGAGGAPGTSTAKKSSWQDVWEK